jgi:hypothetical protein
MAVPHGMVIRFKYLLAFLYDTRGDNTHTYLAANHGAWLGNSRCWTDYPFFFFVTLAHATHLNACL